MPLHRLALTLIAIIVLSEAGLALWRQLPVPVSDASVFSFPPAAANFGNPGKLGTAIEMYGADRGTEWNSTAPDGSRLTVFYFEWDRVSVGPMLTLTGHAPDACNISAGFNLKELLPDRRHEIQGQPTLVFDSTHFTDPAGRDVFIFKMPWIQGIGSLPIRTHAKRETRLARSFTRHTGAGRVLQGGIFDAHNADHAWNTFRSQVLEQLEW